MEPSEARDPRLIALAQAAFAVALYLALVVASFGILSLLTDTDVIDVDASLLLGPSMVATSIVIVALRLVGAAVHLVQERERGDLAVRVPLGGGLLTGLGALVGYVVIGGMLRAVALRDPGVLLEFALHELLRPYSLAIGVLAALVHISFVVMIGLGGDDPKRPLWPWEKD
ncbi:hypothetical protein [Paramicrobacterium agarici]|uniref:Uncharacterized protein n=1 Tax=Paramicrobacterium agarici TaxID=630514 RepID=A0A2A9DZC7_9MICO|nr:hypothetical protein [Microbacterium agarici]PFG32157.1 hypothetical protein ATJ78_3141 [Microbacterium agarici]